MNDHPNPDLFSAPGEPCVRRVARADPAVPVLQHRPGRLQGAQVGAGPVRVQAGHAEAVAGRVLPEVIDRIAQSLMIRVRTHGTRVIKLVPLGNCTILFYHIYSTLFLFFLVVSKWSESIRVV